MWWVGVSPVTTSYMSAVWSLLLGAFKDFLLPVLLLAEQAEFTILDLGSAKKNTQCREQADKTIGLVLLA